MEKIEKLIKLKGLLNSGRISKQEYQRLKGDLINSSSIIHEGDLNSKAQNPLNLSGSLTLYFPGVWILFDSRTKININGEFHSVQSTRKGFKVKVPLNLPNLKIELISMGMITTYINLSELNVSKDYVIELEYDNAWGKYSNKITLKEYAKN